MKLKCINNKPFSNAKVAPELEIDKIYNLESKILDKKGNEHYNVGLKSQYNFITSQETREELKDGHKIHWCHPSRFEIIEE